MTAVPSPAQYAWQEAERSMFIHFGPATWQGREYDDGSVPVKQINPTQLDTEEWCRAALAFGAKRIVFVAKHTGGFCWWQTDTTEYSVKNCPWKGGKGDVLRELSQSCKNTDCVWEYIYIPGTVPGGRISAAAERPRILRFRMPIMRCFARSLPRCCRDTVR